MAEDTEDAADRAPPRLFAVTKWDAVPALLGLGHFAFVVLLVLAFPGLSWGAFLTLALLYALAIAWNIHSVSHNLIHNPFFGRAALNRAYSLLVSGIMEQTPQLPGVAPVCRLSCSG